MWKYAWSLRLPVPDVEKLLKLKYFIQTKCGVWWIKNTEYIQSVFTLDNNWKHCLGFQFKVWISDT